MRFTWDSCIDKFAELYRLLKPADQETDDRIAAEKACAAMDDFLKEIGMWFNWKSLGIDETGAEQITKNNFRLGDHTCNTRVPNEAEIREMVMAGRDR